MKYIEQTTTENKRFIDYLKGSLIFIFFNFIGQIPLSLYIISQSDFVGEFTSHQDLYSKLPSNLTLFLILLPFAVVLPFIYLVVTRPSALFCSPVLVPTKCPKDEFPRFTSYID